ncbi:MAG: hypothetical protein RLZZ359_1019, partial [Actinomycetota bacterium]
AFTLAVVSFENEVLTLKFLSQKDLESFKTSNGAPDVLRKAIFDVLGIQVKFKPLIAEVATSTKAIDVVAPVSLPKVEAPAPVVTEPIKVVEAETPVASEPELPEADEQEPVEAEAEEPELPEVDEPDVEPAFEAEAEAPKSRNSHMVDESARYGESLLREMLGAKPIDEKGKK